MILEHADLRIRPGEHAAFDEAIVRGIRDVVSRSPGFRGWSVHKGVESPERYILQIAWDSVDAHVKGFREGPLFAQWRAIVGPYFAAPPVVEHFIAVAADRGASPTMD